MAPIDLSRFHGMKLVPATTRRTGAHVAAYLKASGVTAPNFVILQRGTGLAIVAPDVVDDFLAAGWRTVVTVRASR